MAKNLSYETMKIAKRTGMLPFFLLVFLCSCHDYQRGVISFRENENIIDSLILYTESHDEYSTFLITRPMDSLSEFDNLTGFVIGPMFDELMSYCKHSFYFYMSGKKIYIYNDVLGFIVKQKDRRGNVSDIEKGNWLDYYNNAWYIHIDADCSITLYRSVKDMVPSRVETNVEFKNMH